MNGKMKIYSTLLKFIHEHILLYDTKQAHPFLWCYMCRKMDSYSNSWSTGDMNVPRKENIIEIIKLHFTTGWVLVAFNKNYCGDKGKTYELETVANEKVCLWERHTTGMVEGSNVMKYKQITRWQDVH